MNKDKKKVSIKNRFIQLMSNEKWQSISIPVAAILISFIAAAIVIFMLGKNPFQAFLNLLQGSGILPKPSYAGYKSMLTDFLSLLNGGIHQTPLVQ